jgi:hypothetical protein
LVVTSTAFEDAPAKLLAPPLEPYADFAAGAVVAAVVAALVELDVVVLLLPQPAANTSVAAAVPNMSAFLTMTSRSQGFGACCR